MRLPRKRGAMLGGGSRLTAFAPCSRMLGPPLGSRLALRYDDTPPAGSRPPLVASMPDSAGSGCRRRHPAVGSWDVPLGFRIPRTRFYREQRYPTGPRPQSPLVRTQWRSHPSSSRWCSLARGCRSGFRPTGHRQPRRWPRAWARCLGRCVRATSTPRRAPAAAPALPARPVARRGGSRASWSGMW